MFQIKFFAPLLCILSVSAHAEKTCRFSDGYEMNVGHTRTLTSGNVTWQIICLRDFSASFAGPGRLFKLRKAVKGTRCGKPDQDLEVTQYSLFISGSGVALSSKDINITVTNYKEATVKAGTCRSQFGNLDFKESCATYTDANIYRWDGKATRQMLKVDRQTCGAGYVNAEQDRSVSVSQPFQWIKLDWNHELDTHKEAYYEAGA